MGYGLMKGFYGSSINCFFIVGLQFLKCSFTLVNSAFKNLVRLEKSNL